MTIPELGQLIQAVTSPGRFFLGAGGTMKLAHQPAATVRWEVFRGHLLDASQTREMRSFAIWDLMFRWPDEGMEQPLVSFLFESSTDVVHVTRSILVYGWEAFESAPHVIESREVKLWRRELVGSISVNKSPPQIEQELTQDLHLAIVGTSRLPITSLESPLPAFSLGRLAYFARLNKSDENVAKVGTWVKSADELIARSLAVVETIADQARLLEVVLRAASADESPRLAAGFFDQWAAAGRSAAALPAVVRTLFGQLALSPYTGISERLVAMLETWMATDRLGPEPVVDLLGYMLRHLVRHLTAFDLVTFHNRGANYPDALLLDALLKAYVRLIATHPELFADSPARSDATERIARRRRRALRQACLVRRLYQGHPVPQTPTSPGENLRVLPAGIPRIADEELLYPGKRHKMLYAGDPIENWLGDKVQLILDQSCSELRYAEELRELGMATFLDRPLGAGKEPGEVDRTPLLSYEAFSPSLAIDRLRQMRLWGTIANEVALDELIALVGGLSTVGLPAAYFTGPQRPGVVALADASKTADDFVFFRTTTQSLREFCAHFDWRPLLASHPELAHWLWSGHDVLLIRNQNVTENGKQRGSMTAFDHELLPRAELGLPHGEGVGSNWTMRNGVELPRGAIEIHMPGSPAAQMIRLPLALTG